MGVIFSYGPLYAHVEQSKDLSGIGIDEKLGQFVPLDLTFNDEDGNPVTLKQLIHTPDHSCPCLFALPQCLQSSTAESGGRFEQITG